MPICIGLPEHKPATVLLSVAIPWAIIIALVSFFIGGISALTSVR